MSDEEQQPMQQEETEEVAESNGFGEEDNADSAAPADDQLQSRSRSPSPQLDQGQDEPQEDYHAQDPMDQADERDEPVAHPGPESDRGRDDDRDQEEWGKRSGEGEGDREGDADREQEGEGSDPDPDPSERERDDRRKRRKDSGDRDDQDARSPARGGSQGRGGGGERSRDRERERDREHNRERDRDQDRGDRGDRGDRDRDRERTGDRGGGISGALGAPRPGEDPSLGGRRLFVGGINVETTEDTLKNYFKKYGAVDTMTLLRDKLSRSRGFGFVTFTTKEDAAYCLSKAEHKLDNRSLTTAIATAERRTGGYRDHHLRTKRIYVGNLDKSVDEEDLKSVFRVYGKLSEVEIIYTPDQKESRGFGFVTFQEMYAAEKVIQKDEIVVKGKTAKISPAQPLKFPDRVAQKKEAPHDPYYVAPRRGRGDSREYARDSRAEPRYRAREDSRDAHRRSDRGRPSTRGAYEYASAPAYSSAVAYPPAATYGLYGGQRVAALPAGSGAYPPSTYYPPGFPQGYALVAPAYAQSYYRGGATQGDYYAGRDSGRDRGGGGGEYAAYPARDERPVKAARYEEAYPARERERRGVSRDRSPDRRGVYDAYRGDRSGQRETRRLRPY